MGSRVFNLDNNEVLSNLCPLKMIDLDYDCGGFCQHQRHSFDEEVESVGGSREAERELDEVCKIRVEDRE